MFIDVSRFLSLWVKLNLICDNNRKKQRPHRQKGRWGERVEELDGWKQNLSDRWIELQGQRGEEVAKRLCDSRPAQVFTLTGWCLAFWCRGHTLRVGAVSMWLRAVCGKNHELADDRYWYSTAYNLYAMYYNRASITQTMTFPAQGTKSRMDRNSWAAQRPLACAVLQHLHGIIRRWCAVQP